VVSKLRISYLSRATELPHLVSLVGSGGGGLALLAGGELSKVTVVVTLPVCGGDQSQILAK
jgi:hypothetical protein